MFSATISWISLIDEPCPTSASLKLMTLRLLCVFYYDNLMTIYCQYTVWNFSTIIIMQESIK